MAVAVAVVRYIPCRLSILIVGSRLAQALLGNPQLMDAIPKAVVVGETLVEGTGQTA
jgi:hypothetical protein